MDEVEMRRRLERLHDEGADFWALEGVVQRERSRLGEDGFHEVWLYAWALVRTRSTVLRYWGNADYADEIGA